MLLRIRTYARLDAEIDGGRVAQYSSFGDMSDSYYSLTSRFDKAH